jgi:type III secretory pathway component EscR
MNMEKSIEITKEIVNLSQQKEKHLEEYKNYIQKLADTKSTAVFFQGSSCIICNDLNKQIKDKLVELRSIK